MAEWIKARGDLADDPVVIRQARALEIDKDAVVGKWIRVWAWAREHTGDGFVADCDLQTIDDVARLDGFCAAAGRWLVWERGGVTFPKWEMHNGNGARERFQATERQRLSRSRHASVTVERDKSVTRLDKTRRDKNREEGLDQSGRNPPIEASPIRSDLLKGGLTVEQADEVLTHPLYDEARVRHALAQMARSKAAGKPAKLPQRFVLTQAGMEQSMKQKAYGAKARVQSELAAYRNGEAHPRPQGADPSTPARALVIGDRGQGAVR